jgi:hypothetical protein
MSYAVMRAAILAKQQVTCIYDGLQREVCPHALGRKNGKEQVLVFQFAGQSSRGLPPGGEWRCMQVARISNAAAEAGEWHTGTGHSRPQTCVDQIDVEVPY